MPTYDDTGALLVNISGGSAPVGASYVVMALDGTLTNERVLTGTANQVILVDGGAGGAATLSTPQDIATTSSPTFANVYVPDGGFVGVQAGEGWLFDDTNGDITTTAKLGIGWTNPSYRLDILRDAGSTITHPLLRLQSQNAGSVDGDSFILYGTQATNWAAGVDQADSNKFKIEAGGLLTSAADFTITTTGDVGINDVAPGAQLSVDQSSGTGAKPVLTLEQADVDYVLAKIIATAAAASADRTLVADSDYNTPGALVGWIQIEIQDDGNRVADGDYYIPFYAAPT